jgi:hypothetical protein
MYSVTRRNLIEQEKDNKRITADITRIFGLIARNLITERAKPFDFEEYEIEHSGTMRAKTLRLLREVGFLRYCTRTKEGYYSYTKVIWNFEEAFMEHSKEYAKPADFPDVPKKIDEYLKNREVREDRSYSVSEYTFNSEGYQEIDKMYLDACIHVYWNLQDYDIQRSTVIDKNYSTPRVIKSAWFYPKAKLVQRNKAILRMLLKKYSELDFKAFMENRFGDNYDGQIEVTNNEEGRDDEVLEEKDIHFEICLRNFAKFPVTLAESQRCFRSPRGYIAEYKKKSDQATFEFNRLKRLVDQVNAAGGCPVIAKEYIQKCCNEIVTKAPLLIDGSDGDKLAMEFILDHRDIFTYEYLFSQGVSS